MPFYNQNAQITTTWANKPLATAYVGNARITDVGVGGSNWYSDGTAWRHDGAVMMFQRGTGWIVHSMLAANASTFSQVGANVTVTSVGHGLTAAAHNGCSIYLILAGVGTWCTNVTYVSSSSFTCTSPTSQTASGAITTNTSETIITDTITTIPAGLMGSNGVISILGYTLVSSTSTAKTAKLYYDTTAFMAAVASTSIFSNISRYIKNTAIAKQITAKDTTLFEVSTNPSQYLTVDSSISKDIKASLIIAAANEFCVLQGLQIMVTPS